MTVLLICLLVALSVSASAAMRNARIRAREAQQAEDREYLEACLDRERSHDYPLSDYPSRRFEEGFWRGWNR